MNIIDDLYTVQLYYDEDITNLGKQCKPSTIIKVSIWPTILFGANAANGVEEIPGAK
jgi:hypothetical protein